ncbi:hypothetical protein SUNI508_10642 [Seiridium unicorne]|uniref:Uncharacterized protein n=1 Tax=Seiridium unicorne TaxID=138068 RepID=A0ABR2UK83_9PEZI
MSPQPLHHQQKMVLTKKELKSLLKLWGRFESGRTRLDVIMFIGVPGVGQKYLIRRLSHGIFVDLDLEFDRFDANEVWPIPTEFELPGAEGRAIHADCDRGISGYQTLRQSRAILGEALMFLYDVTSRDSFKAAQEYYEGSFELFGIVNRPSNKQGTFTVLLNKWRIKPFEKSLPPYIVVAHKIEEPKARWAVTSEEGQAWSTRIGRNSMKFPPRLEKDAPRRYSATSRFVVPFGLFRRLKRKQGRHPTMKTQADTLK